jgi:hypothetical protein
LEAHERGKCHPGRGRFSRAEKTRLLRRTHSTLQSPSRLRLSHRRGPHPPPSPPASSTCSEEEDSNPHRASFYGLSHHRGPHPPSSPPASSTGSEEEDTDLRKKTWIRGLTAEDEDTTPRLDPVVVILRSGEHNPFWLQSITGMQTSLLLSSSVACSSRTHISVVPRAVKPVTRDTGPYAMSTLAH